MKRALLLVMVLPGCIEPPVACTEEARSSVQVTVVDASGAPIDDAVVTFQPEGGQETPCESFGGSFTCGFEVDGDITIRVTADGFQPAEQTVTVGRTPDDCHVETEQITITLAT